MRLKTIKLTNFRCYKNKTEISFDEAMTAFVGRNDAGKSTILEALAIFFEIDGFKADKNDMNCFGLSEDDTEFSIACEFDQLPAEIVIDEQVKTTLSEEFLLNDSGCLEIIKIFKETTSGKANKTAIRCKHPEEEPLNNLLGLKISELKKLGADFEQNVIDKRSSVQWRRAIREGFSPFRCKESLLDVDKDLTSETKSIWGKIQDQLPVFALFKADRESNDGDSEAKNPLQQAVKNAQENLRPQISAIEKSVLDVANRTLEKLNEMVPEIANELIPRFREKPKWTFNFTLDGENGIPINKRGSGIRRLILLNFFRAEAEKKVSEIPRNIIYAIEEPETSQHPDNQILLMKVLLSLSNQDNRQIIITTHVPALAGLIPEKSVRFVTKDSNSNLTVIKEADNDHVLQEVTESLGILSEFCSGKGILLVEGKSDVFFWKHASECLKKAGHLTSSLEDENIVPMIIGGCGNLKHWITEKTAKLLNMPCCVVLDSDSGGEAKYANTNKEHAKLAISEGYFVHMMRKREVENYICPELIREKTDKTVSFSDTDDAKKL